MNRLLVLVLSIVKFFTRISRRLQGVSGEEAAYDRLVSGKVWEEFCDTLKAAGASVMGFGSPKDALSQAEGYRYLSRLIRAGLENFLEFADPGAPVFRRLVHETVKMGADNPDNYYYNAPVSGAFDYLITGTRGTVHFLGFSTQKGSYGRTGGLPSTGFLDADGLKIKPGGSFEITVSAAPKSGNWLPMEPETSMIIVRQTFLDREKETPADLHISRIGSDGQTPVPSAPTPESVTEGLLTAAKLVSGASFLFANWARDFKKHVNSLPQFDPEKSTAAGGDPKIAYYHSYWKLEQDEALVIETTPPECEHWNFQLNNHWMESLDYRYFTIHVNKHTAVYGAEGSVKVIVAHEDPGLPNWINTTGHGCGTMCWRWIKASEHPEPRTRVVKLAELRALSRGSVHG
ncbi:MAG: DUF1214 domain-containing protein [Spirochaetales bacterium]|nr:MAG: DUF1214 domain-containing protein [Spirochaetales bacterium]